MSRTMETETDKLENTFKELDVLNKMMEENAIKLSKKLEGKMDRMERIKKMMAGMKLTRSKLGSIKKYQILF